MIEMTQKIYEKSDLYDLFSSQQDFRKETDFMVRIVGKFLKSNGNYLLNVGCGTGSHDRLLKKDFRVTGIDLNEDMLRLAKKKNPGIDYRLGDMRSFRLDRKFDVAIAMTGVMSYNYTYRDLAKTLNNLYRHLEKGGILIFNWGVVKEVAFEKGRLKNFVKVSTFSTKDLDCVLLNNAYDPDKTDTTMESHLIFLVRRKNGPLQVIIDKHVQALFELRKVKKILDEIGFEYHLYENDFSGKKYKTLGPIFVCVK